MSARYAGYERVMPDELTAFLADLSALGEFDGLVFLDPEEGLDPAFLAAEARKVRPDIRLVLPLVARDRNRVALLGAARTALAVGADALLLLSGRMDPASPAQTVYELDPLQMLGFLKERGIAGEFWVSSRCSTGAEQSRVRSLAGAGAGRCLVPWSADEPPAPCAPLAPVLSVAEADWAAGSLPAEEMDQVLHVAPGRGRAAAAARRREEP